MNIETQLQKILTEDLNNCLSENQEDLLEYMKTRSGRQIVATGLGAAVGAAGAKMKGGSALHGAVLGGMYGGTVGHATSELTRDGLEKTYQGASKLYRKMRDKRKQSQAAKKV